MMFYGPWGGYGFGAGYWLMWLSMSFWWIAAVVAIALLIRWLFKASSPKTGIGESDAALEALKVRYARGEIGKDEFEAIRRDISA